MLFVCHETYSCVMNFIKNNYLINQILPKRLWKVRTPEIFWKGLKKLVTGYSIENCEKVLENSS